MVEKVSREKLKSYIDRVERVEGEMSVLKEERSEIYGEAKSDGFDTKILRRVIRLRKQSRDARAEEEALLDTYLEAIGER